MRRLAALTLLIALLLVPATAYASSKRVLPVGRTYPGAVERWRPVIRRYGYHVKGKCPGWWQQQALAVIWAESDGSPFSGPCVGIWQLARCHHPNRNAVHDTKIATAIYVSSGRSWRAWTVCRKLRLR